MKNYICLNDLPIYKDGTYKGKIDWSNSLDCKVNFNYKDIEGYIKILGYIKNDNLLKIQYKNNLYDIRTSDFRKCKLGKIIGTHTREFKYKINQTLNDEKRDLIIIDREHRKNKNGVGRKYYKYKCNKCGFDCGEHYKNGEYKEEFWIVESHLIGGNGCSCCTGKVVVPEINSIWAKAPWMIDLGVSIEDAKRYTKGSGERIIVTCPDCGNKKKISIYSINKNRSISCICGDGVKYPEKFMANVLTQLRIDFKTQHAPKWIDKRFYDFYIPSLNMIIETHGRQHYEEASGFKRTLAEEQENDRIKKELALANGVEHYVEINCSKSELEWMKFNVYKQLNNYFDMRNVDFSKAEEFALKNMAKLVCDYWNKNHNTKYIMNNMQLSNPTVITYLKKGNALGWCKYDPKIELIKNLKIAKKNTSKRVEIFKNNISLGVFNSCSELERKSEELFGVKLNNSKISQVCNNKQKHHKGFTFKYVTEKD